MCHPNTQFGDCAATLFLAHVVETSNAVFQRRRYRLLEGLATVIVRNGIHRTGQLQYRVQIGLGADAEFFGYVAEGAKIAAHKFAIHGKRGPAASLQRNGDFEMTAMQALLQNASNLHLQRVKLRGLSQMKIKEAMVDRLQAQGQRELVADMRLYLGIPGHGANIHSRIYSAPEGASTSANCNS